MNKFHISTGICRINFKCKQNHSNVPWRRCIDLLRSVMAHLSADDNKNYHPVNAHEHDCIKQRASIQKSNGFEMVHLWLKKNFSFNFTQAKSVYDFLFERVNVCRLQPNILHAIRPVWHYSLGRRRHIFYDAGVCVCSVFAFIGRCFMRAHTRA